MTNRFLKIEQPASFGSLNEVQRQQFAIASEGYDGGLRSPEERFIADDSDESFVGYLDYCELGDEEPRFDLWLYAVDSGRLFEHGKTLTVARIFQGYLQFGQRDEEVLSALGEALKHQRAVAPQATSNPLPRLPHS